MHIAKSEKYVNSIKKIVLELPKESKKYLVTGATGLIGSCIVDALLMANREYGIKNVVYAVSRSRKKLFNRFFYAAECELICIEQDICYPINFNISVDYVIHGASNADPCSYALYPVETMLTNIYGTNNVLNYAQMNNVGRMIFLSTFEVYGNTNKNGIYNETDCGNLNFNLLRSAYPESKRCSELLLNCFRDEYGIDFVIGRLCSIYGPTMKVDDSKAHAQFLRKALNNENIVIKSKGLQSRTYLYVVDAVTAIFKILFNGDTGEIYNISSENSITTIANLAETVSSVSGTKVVFDVPNDVESKGFSVPQDCILNNNKLKNLGWVPQYDIKSGIKETFDILSEMKVIGDINA